MTPSSTRSRTPREREGLLPPAQGRAIQCQFCSGREFRRSRLRNEDLAQLFLLRYPVRCMRCGQRQLVSLTVAALAVSSTTRQPRPQRPANTEKSWTEPAERMVLHEDETQEPPQS